MHQGRFCPLPAFPRLPSFLFLFCGSRNVSMLSFFLALFSSRRRVALLTLSCASRAQLRHVFPSCISYPSEQFADHHRGRAQSPNLLSPLVSKLIGPQRIGTLVISHSPPPPGRIEPLRRGPSNLPPLKITVDLSPWGPFPICLKDSISHSKWKRNWSDGMGSL
jgi:hypothetical protein